MRASQFIELHQPHKKTRDPSDRALKFLSKVCLMAAPYSASSAVSFFFNADLKMSPSEAPESDEPN